MVDVQPRPYKKQVPYKGTSKSQKRFWSLTEQERETIRAKRREASVRRYAALGPEAYEANLADQRRRYRRKRDEMVLRKHNITSEKYWRLFDKQGGLCAICHGPPTPNPRWNGAASTAPRLAVDHDHTTGRVRGLLCGPCNLALGKFQDDPEVVRRAAEYLLSGWN